MIPVQPSIKGKLVRDRIPAIKRAKGDRVIVSVLDTTGFVNALLERIKEEAEKLPNTVHVSKKAIPDSIAELHLLLRSLCEAMGIPMQTVDDIYNHRYKNEGGYDARLFQMEIPPSPPPAGEDKKDT